MVGRGEQVSPSGLLPRFSATSGYLPRTLPPLGVAIWAPRVRTGPGSRLPGEQGTEQDRMHPEVTNAVSSSLFGHFPLLANKSSVEPKT